jgi:hypothetical protein
LYRCPCPCPSSFHPKKCDKNKIRASIANILATAGVALAATATVSEPSLQEIEAAAATTLPLSPVSNVKGLAFNKFYQIWLENIVSSIGSSYNVVV